MSDFNSAMAGSKRPKARCAAWLVVCAAIAIGDSAQAADIKRDWKRVDGYEEYQFTAAADPEMRFHVNAPLDDGKPARATRLILFALPNGNTIEQTLGCQLTDGLDWHYDIQHVAAQTRLLRKLFPDERIVLICAEAKGLSWPTWRRTHENANAEIARLIDEWRDEFATPNSKVFLTGHSGGGSFIFGAIEGTDELPAYIDRIAPLDANYSFDASLHEPTLRKWLQGDADRRLIVIAYDDREITFNGKKVVGPDGGTFRATGRMRDALRPTFLLIETERPPFLETSGLDGRIRFYVHPNPKNKILHTALVGDMNGLVHAATLGTPQEEKWGTFGGPRAYTEFVQPNPTPSGEAHQ